MNQPFGIRTPARLLSDHAEALLHGVKTGWRAYRASTEFSRDERSVDVLMAYDVRPGMSADELSAKRDAMTSDFRKAMTRTLALVSTMMALTAAVGYIVL